MRNGYTDKQLDAIEKIMDQLPHLPGMFQAGEDGWEDVISGLYDIIQAKRAAIQFRDSIVNHLKDSLGLVDAECDPNGLNWTRIPGPVDISGPMLPSPRIGETAHTMGPGHISPSEQPFQHYVGEGYQGKIEFTANSPQVTPTQGAHVVMPGWAAYLEESITEIDCLVCDRAISSRLVRQIAIVAKDDSRRSELSIFVTFSELFEKVKSRIAFGESAESVQAWLDSDKAMPRTDQMYPRFLAIVVKGLGFNVETTGSGPYTHTFKIPTELSGSLEMELQVSLDELKEVLQNPVSDPLHLDTCGYCHSGDMQAIAYDSAMWCRNCGTINDGEGAERYLMTPHGVERAVKHGACGFFVNEKTNEYKTKHQGVDVAESGKDKTVKYKFKRINDHPQGEIEGAGGVTIRLTTPYEDNGFLRPTRLK